jgi:hypothetical protein
MDYIRRWRNTHFGRKCLEYFRSLIENEEVEATVLADFKGMCVAYHGGLSVLAT